MWCCVTVPCVNVKGDGGIFLMWPVMEVNGVWIGRGPGSPVLGLGKFITSSIRLSII